MTEPEHFLIKLVKAKILKNNSNNFREVKKTSSSSNAWRNILVKEIYLKKDLTRLLTMKSY